LFYGLLVDLRFVGWLFVAPVLIRTSGFSMSSWQQLLLLPLVAVSIFAVLQSTVLPHNFLSHFGYNKISTITPYQTINQDTSTIRAQSTLRGANQLGAYLVIGISLLIVMYGSFKQKWRPLAGLFLAGSALALSFSRSAWIGTIVAVAIGLYIGVRGRRNRTIVYIIVLIIILGSVAGGLALRSSKGVQDALLHVSSSSTARQTSNSGHATALKSGLQDLVREPLGRGPGTAGPASLYNTNFGERNSENYYLQIGQEYGWAGLLLFLVINVVLLVELYRLRTKSLACGLLVSGLGLIFVNLLSFAWSDPTVAYIWWGLAGVALLKPFKPSVNTIADKKKG
jgi:O-antigen ligase